MRVAKRRMAIKTVAIWLRHRAKRSGQARPARLANLEQSR